MANSELRLVIERWNRPRGAIDYRWSLWHAGKRVAMGGPHGSAEEAENEAQAACLKSLGRKAEAVERL